MPPRTGLSVCGNCSAGTYQPDTGKDACIDCPAGTYQNDDGQGYCKECPIGTYNNQTGMMELSKCLDCPCGTYALNVNTTACTLCPPGKYNPGVKKSLAADCVNCEAGKFCANYGSCAVTACPMRSTSSEGAAICDCDNGAYYNASELIEYCPGNPRLSESLLCSVLRPLHRVLWRLSQLLLLLRKCCSRHYQRRRMPLSHRGRLLHILQHFCPEEPMQALPSSLSHLQRANSRRLPYLSHHSLQPSSTIQPHLQLHRRVL